MITVACPHPQTARCRIIYRIPEQTPSSPEHAGALPLTPGSGCPSFTHRCDGKEMDGPLPPSETAAPRAHEPQAHDR